MLYQTTNPHGGDIYGEEVLLDFSANTNPFGTPQGVLDAVRAALPELHRYPDPYCRRLTQAISDFEGVPKESILCGSGAAELIYAYCDAVRPQRAVELAPTFSEYALGLQRVGCQVERYLLRQASCFALEEDFLEFLEKTAPEAVFLCNPNNPTGRLMAPTLLERVLLYCREQNVRLFVDECFLDLSDGGESLKEFLADNPNLFILKAFTKSYGMAGIRLGYCLTSDKLLLARMSQAVQPWNVSSLAQAAGVAALEEQAFLQKTKALISIERPWLKQQLEGFDFWVCPSGVNFLLFQGPEDLHLRLKQKKIAIRSCANFHGLGPGWYRIAVRRHEENEALILAIREVLSWQKTS
ncbi:MAG: pyridoxal phosphate-dependent aminotransferase [Faecousia sp.]